MATHRWATWANLLTAFRLASIPATFFAIAFGDWLIAATLFTLAAVSDFYDGQLARRFNQATSFGGLFDHATDALYVTSCCTALATLGLVNPWLCALIPTAFAQYMLDSRALTGRPLRTSLIGRYNGVAYFVLAGTAIGASLLGWQWLLGIVAVAAWLLVATTVVSMLDRLLTLLRG